jgi:acyl-coenzyme A thioesterase PaaI-like protein
MSESSKRLCFGCGQDNPGGLGMSFSYDGTAVRGELVARPQHQGFPGHAHGGVIAAALDEAMGWAVHHAGLLAITARLEVRYRRPLPLGAQAFVRAWVCQARGRRILAQAVMEDAAGATLAEARALFLRLPGGGGAAGTPSGT